MKVFVLTSSVDGIQGATLSKAEAEAWKGKGVDCVVHECEADFGMGGELITAAEYALLSLAGDKAMTAAEHLVSEVSVDSDRKALLYVKACVFSQALLDADPDTGGLLCNATPSEGTEEEVPPEVFEDGSVTTQDGTPISQA